MRSNKPSASPSPAGDAPAPAPAGVRREPRGGVAGGLRIVGQIQGQDDLLIAGQVNGSVFLPECAVHVGPDAEVSADVTARVIEVEGRVNGDLSASERIAIRRTGVVTGDAVAPQIQIDEGCLFKGSVQMRKPDTGQHCGATAGRRAANE